MKYVGIDLGTTNSAICTFDGETVRLLKSPEQHDVTPSAIFIDRRGNRFVGARAYNNAARSPDSSAVLFKRLMGSSTPITLSAANVTLTPEECSAEILRVLFGYLDDEYRAQGEAGTVITVPAAFNQMQKDATLSAASSADLGLVALMQEPVAAVMSVMRSRKSDGIFLVYDLGGGTLDIAIAESVANRVSLLSHGGIAMCGGRDFDRELYSRVVVPWLLKQFDLPEDFGDQPQYKTLVRMAVWAAEKAKIELSQRQEAAISLPETDLGIKDRRGTDIYVDITLTRQAFDAIVSAQIDASISAARDTMGKAGISPGDVERIVFVGGPTHYKPLRDRVSAELGIAASTEVNPMTAVAEGAAVFAESIDWTSQSRGRKSMKGAVQASGGANISFSFVARTPDTKARIVAKVAGVCPPNVEFQIDSLDTGWSSGRAALREGAHLDLPLSKPGENTFKIFIFDASGGQIKLDHERIVIARTAASIDAIPASHSIGIEARDKAGGRHVLDYLVREGEQLPKKGKLKFFAGESLKAGSAASLNFKIWEGSIDDPITDNRFVGMFEIKGSDFENQAIVAGAELLCAYEIADSGNISLEVTVPSIGGSFHSGRNFYSRQEGQVDFSKASTLLAEQAKAALERVEAIQEKVEDPRLDEAHEKLTRASNQPANSHDPEQTKKALDDVQDAKRLLAETKKTHLRTIRQMDLERVVGLFDDAVRVLARPAEESSFDNLVRTAQRCIDNGSSDFDSHLGELRGKNFAILWRQDWFVIDRFKHLAEHTHLFPDAHQHAVLVVAATEALKASDMDKLRVLVFQLDDLRIGSIDETALVAASNIVRS